MTAMSRRDRAVLAVLGMVVLYGLAVLLFFTGREAAWAKARFFITASRAKLAKVV